MACWGRHRVQAAAPEPGEIERYESETNVSERVHDLVAVFQGLREVRQRQLKAGDFAVMSHAEAPEAEDAQICLRLPDLIEFLNRDNRAVRNARGEAGMRGFVPRRQAKRVRDRADVRLCQPR